MNTATAQTAPLELVTLESQAVQIRQALESGLYTPEEEAELACLLEEQDYVLAERSLFHFVKAAWPIIEPGKEFSDNWHHRTICEHLEAVTFGIITRLIINIPPRCTKSTIVSVLWPVWTWIQEERRFETVEQIRGYWSKRERDDFWEPAPPDEDEDSRVFMNNRQFLTGSHGGNLATRDATNSRTLIESPWFQARWGERLKFKKDQNQKTRYEFKSGGRRIAFGMTSGVLGEGGDFLVIDDPHPSTEGMFSGANQEMVRNTYDQTLSTRLNHPERSAVVVIMQRLAVGDLSGHLLAGEEHWEHVRLPMEYEPKEPCETILGKADPRTGPDELLWPSHMTREVVEARKIRLGTFGRAGQFQQRPNPMGGGLVKLDWFQRYRVLPNKEKWIEVVQFWDTAQKPDELLNAPWVCGTWIRTKSGLYLKDVFRKWMDYPRGKRMVASLAAKENPNRIVIEDKSTGSSLIQDFREDKDTRLPIVGFEPEGDKITRLAVESPAVEAGIVWLPESASWLPDFELEIEAVPNSSYMDQADMLSMALRYFRKGGRRLPFKTNMVKLS